MLPAANRLRTAADFRETTRAGVKSARGCVVVYLSRPAEGGGAARVGVVTSKAIGGSVIRHRAARRIRGAMAQWVPSLPLGSRVVVRALPGADKDTNLSADVETCLIRVLERA